MALPTYTKHPSSIRAYPINVLLGSLTITAASSTVTVGAGLTVDSTSFSGSTVTVVLSAGTDAIQYQVETQIDLSDGQRLIQEFLIHCVDN